MIDLVKKNDEENELLFEDDENVEGMIQAIIKANKNLTESNGRNDWEMMGADIKELQSLIDSLEKMVKKENSKFNVTTSDF